MPRSITHALALCLAVTLLAASLLPGHAQSSASLYLPIVRHRAAPLAGDTRLGVRLDNYDHNPDAWAPYLVPDAVYALDALWHLIETAPGAYNWSGLDASRDALDGYASRIIVTVKAAPAWAREWPEIVSSRPAEEYWDDYAHFINQVIDHTGAWAIEIWNEPAQTCYLGIIDAFGCWIPPTNGETTYLMFFEAGANYGRMLQTVIPIVKGAHPQVKIIAGAIAGYSLGGQQSTFVQGIRSMGLEGVDFMSMHLYMNSDNVKDLQNAYFDLTLQYASRLHADTLLPVILSETAVRTGGYNDKQLLPSAQFLQDQDEYLNRMLETLPNHPGVHAILWFTLAGCGYENTDLIFNRGVGVEKLKPVYCTWAAALGHPEACQALAP